MSKRIILCTDGTWDNAQSNTNVYKLYRAIQSSPEQIAFYEDGVGSDGNLFERLAGGAIGEGLFQKIKEGYTNIAHVYEEGDEIFLFGFSRGAYTARSLAGMIAVCGLPTVSTFDSDLVETAFTAYRNKAKRAQLLANLNNRSLFDAQIKMIGVWDTVGALGIPAAFGGIDHAQYGFLDTGLHQDVKNAFHALSIDERRIEFPPTLWTTPSSDTQTVEQVWFSGVHCDVGGGYEETGLSDITLSWMMGKAKNLGLKFNDQALKRYNLDNGTPLDAKYALDELHESWNVAWGFPRKRDISHKATLANSVAIRVACDDSYEPANISIKNGTLADSYAQLPVVTAPAVGQA